jgi:hypothetical protein
MAGSLDLGSDEPDEEKIWNGRRLPGNKPPIYVIGTLGGLEPPTS